MANSDMRPGFHFPTKDKGFFLPKEKFTKPAKSLSPEEISKLDLSEALRDSLAERKRK